MIYQYLGEGDDITTTCTEVRWNHLSSLEANGVTALSADDDVVTTAKGVYSVCKGVRRGLKGHTSTYSVCFVSADLVRLMIVLSRSL